MTRPAHRLVLLGTLIAALLVAAALFIPKNPTSVAQTAQFNLADLPRLGSETAPISVVLVEDFKCPVCKVFEETILPELQSRYVESGQVKVYTLILPFLAQKLNLTPDDSKLAAQAAKCAFDQLGNDGFYAYAPMIFRAQEDELRVWASKARLKELAQNVEQLDQARFGTCLDTDATAARVEAEEKQAIKASVNGTPSVFVDGKMIEYRTLEELKQKLFAALDQAKS